MQGLDEAARDREAEPGAGPHPIALFRPVELVEDVLQIRGRYAIAFVQNLQTDRILIAPAKKSWAALTAGVATGVDDEGAVMPVPPGPASCNSS